MTGGGKKKDLGNFAQQFCTGGFSQSQTLSWWRNTSLLLLVTHHQTIIFRLHEKYRLCDIRWILIIIYEYIYIWLYMNNMNMDFRKQKRHVSSVQAPRTSPLPSESNSLKSSLSSCDPKPWIEKKSPWGIWKSIQNWFYWWNKSDSKDAGNSTMKIHDWRMNWWV